MRCFSGNPRFEGWTAWVKRQVTRLGFKYNDPNADGLKYWRERILFGVLAAGTGLALLALLPAAYMAFGEKRWGLLVADLAAFALSGCLLVFHRVRLRLRSCAVLLITFLVGVFIIREVGFASGGPAWLFCFAVLAGVLLGVRGALTAILLNAVTMVLLASDLPAPTSMIRVVSAGANFIFLNAVSAISVAVLVNGLEALFKETLAATDALKKEREELLNTREELKNEIDVRLRSERELQHSERKYRLLAENINDVIWTTDMDFRFTYVSPAIQKLQGWTPEEYLHHKLEQVMTPGSIEKVLAEFNRRYTQGERTGGFQQPSILELELNRRDGSSVWTEVTASFVVDDAGKPVGILGVTRDITERRRALVEKEALLESLNRSRKMEAIGTLAGGVAHDLNNVLSGIVTYPDLLLLDLPMDSALRRPIEVIQASGKKAAAIVQDLLTLTRRGVSVSEVVNLNELVAEYLKSPEFQRLLSFHPLVDVQPRLDPGLLNILGSPIHLSKTIMNLVSNAAEAMPNGGRIAVISENRRLNSPIRGYDEIHPGEYSVLKVSDSGVGIPPEDIHRIFEPFFTKKKMGRSGTGLGMAVIWGTVQDHHGYIDVQSTEGRGTTVELFFPTTQQSRGGAKGVSPLDTYRGNGETILIVDDDKEQREIASRIVGQLGYVASSVSCGEAAVEYMKTGQADLLILDMIMGPGIDGFETYKRILTYHPHQKAIITSGFAETTRVRNAQKLGAGGYLKKPYTVENIGMTIKSELDRERATA